MKKYCIGCFIAVILFAGVMTLGYQMTFDYTDAKAQLSRIETQEKALQGSDSISTKGKVEKNSGYYVSMLQGYLVVYYDDKNTIFELTDIPVSSLPQSVREKVENFLFIENEEDLYRFLENYSS